MVVTKDVSDESVVDVMTSAECLEYLKHITNKFISVGMEPPIEISNLEDRIRSPGSDNDNGILCQQ